MEREKLLGLLKGLTDEGARVAVQVLMESHPELLEEGELRRGIFLGKYLEFGGSVSKALRAVGVSYGTYRKWRDDPVFVAQMGFVQMSEVDAVKAKALELAKAGNERMIAFLLTAYDPDSFDFNLRRQRAAVQGQMGILEREAQLVSDERWQQAVKDDPAQEFVTEVVKH